MRCTIPGRGIRGECLDRPLNCCLCSNCINPLCTYFLPAFGKAILCLAKIGDELHIEAEPDGVSLMP